MPIAALGALVALLGSAPSLPELPRGMCVVDETATLKPETLARLQAICVGLAKTGKGQLVVAVARDLHGRENLFKLAMDLFGELRLGHRDRDDGVIVVLHPNKPRGLRVTLGYGLEEGMTDARLQTLLDQEVIPKLKASDPDGALIAIAERLVAMVQEEDASGRIEKHANKRRQERAAP